MWRRGSAIQRAWRTSYGPVKLPRRDPPVAGGFMSLTICNWKYGKQWVYSITYDEALEELHRFAVPHHEEYGIPGHVEAVAGHIGKVRQLGQSSYNGYHHM